MGKNGPITDMHQEYGLSGKYCLTKKGTIIGGVELEGRDPDGLTESDLTALSLIARSIYQNLPDSISSITQYYIHFEGANVRLKNRSNAVSDVLSKNRERFLNGQNLSTSKIVHFFEASPHENLTKLNPIDFFKHLALSVKSESSREIMRRYFSAEKSIVVFSDELERQSRELDDVLEEFKGRWESIFNSRILDAKDLWAYFRFFANLDPTLLTDALSESVPAEQWDLLLAEGDRYPVVIDNQDVLKFQGVENTYALILAVTRLGENEVGRGLWGAKTHAPIRQKGNYVLMMRFSPISKIRQTMMFSSKKKELQRKNLNLYDVFRGVGEQASERASRYGHLKPAIKKKMEELEEAETLEERWGHAHASALVFGRSTKKLNETTKLLRKSMIQAGLSIVSESIDLPDAYKAILPGGRESSIRDLEINSTQFGAATHLYKASEGQIIVEDLQGEEAQYIFHSAYGSPFHFSPYTGGRGVVIGVGPIRSGKSFTKNTLGSHFVKYGGFYRAIDIDQGSETLAQFFGNDGAIFRIGQGGSGFNPFHVAKGPTDLAFISQLKNTVMEMLAKNENKQMRTVEPYEQQQLDKAIVATLRLPKNLQRFSAMVNHCPTEFQQKLSRWYGTGMHAALFDQETDAVGSLDRPVVAFNLAGVKDDPARFPLTMAEIFYRVTRMFEDPDYRTVPKYLDIDEAHALLRIPYVCDYIIRSVRTWGKWLAGIGLWTQDPNEFRKIEDWTALRSAASTFFFMPDPTADARLYKETFDLTDGEIEAIRSMRPKRDAYIIQRDIGVSKKIEVRVEPEQHVISTSRPYEADIRNKLIEKFGVEKGIEATVEELQLKEKVERAA